MIKTMETFQLQADIKILKDKVTGLGNSEFHLTKRVIALEGGKDFTKDMQTAKQEFSKIRADISRLDLGITGILGRYKQIENDLVELQEYIESVTQPKKPKWKFWQYNKK